MSILQTLPLSYQLQSLWPVQQFWLHLPQVVQISYAYWNSCMYCLLAHQTVVLNYEMPWPSVYVTISFCRNLQPSQANHQWPFLFQPYLPPVLGSAYSYWSYPNVVNIPGQSPINLLGHPLYWVLQQIMTCPSVQPTLSNLSQCLANRQFHNRQSVVLAVNPVYSGWHFSSIIRL